MDDPRDFNWDGGYSQTPKHTGRQATGRGHNLRGGHAQYREQYQSQTKGKGQKGGGFGKGGGRGGKGVYLPRSRRDEEIPVNYTADEVPIALNRLFEENELLLNGYMELKSMVKMHDRQIEDLHSQLADYSVVMQNVKLPKTFKSLDEGKNATLRHDFMTDIKEGLYEQLCDSRKLSEKDKAAVRSLLDDIEICPKAVVRIQRQREWRDRQIADIMTTLSVGHGQSLMEILRDIADIVSNSETSSEFPVMIFPDRKSKKRIRGVRTRGNGKGSPAAQTSGPEAKPPSTSTSSSSSSSSASTAATETAATPAAATGWSKRQRKTAETLG